MAFLSPNLAARITRGFPSVVGTRGPPRCERCGRAQPRRGWGAVVPQEAHREPLSLLQAERRAPGRCARAASGSSRTGFCCGSTTASGTSSACSAPPAKSPWRPPASTGTASSTASTTTRSKCAAPWPRREPRSAEQLGARPILHTPGRWRNARRHPAAPGLAGEAPLCGRRAHFSVLSEPLPQLGTPIKLLPSNPLPWGALRAASVSWPVPSPPYHPLHSSHADASGEAAGSRGPSPLRGLPWLCPLGSRRTALRRGAAALGASVHTRLSFPSLCLPPPSAGSPNPSAAGLLGHPWA